MTDPGENDFEGLDDHALMEKVLAEMPRAIATGDWDSTYFLFDMACEIGDSELKAQALNELLIVPGHQHHQEITREIQDLGSPSSIPYIRKMLESGFAMLAYTASEDAVIAKWFSHALARIGTPEAVETISEFSRSRNPGIAAEMSYRLKKIGA